MQYPALLGGINADNLAATAHQCRYGETTGIGETVQHTFIFNVAAGSQAAITLVEVVARFVSVLNIHQQFHAVFFNRQQGRWQLAGDEATGSAPSLLFYVPQHRCDRKSHIPGTAFAGH